MHATTPAFQGDVVGGDDRGFTLQPGMTTSLAEQSGGGEGNQNPVAGQSANGHHLLHPRFGHDQNLSVALNGGINRIRMQGHRHVGRQGPRGGSPD